MAREFEPCIGLWAGSAEPVLDPLSFSLRPSPAHAPSLKINKTFFKKATVLPSISFMDGEKETEQSITEKGIEKTQTSICTH